MMPENWEKLVEIVNNASAMTVAVLALIVPLSVIWKK